MNLYFDADNVTNVLERMEIYSIVDDEATGGPSWFLWSVSPSSVLCTASAEHC